MKYPITLTILIVAIVLSACQKETKHNQSESIVQKYSRDTVITFRFKGSLYSFTFNVIDAPQVKDFQSFLDNWQNKQLSFQQLELADVTGDGIKDSCIFYVQEEVDSNALIIHKILSNNQIIWLDSLLIDNNASYQFGNDSAFVLLKPFTPFYLSLNHIYMDFTGDRYDSTYIPDDTTYWGSSLKGFHGHWISTLDREDSQSFIWDRRINKFALFHSP